MKNWYCALRQGSYPEIFGGFNSSPAKAFSEQNMCMVYKKIVRVLNFHFKEKPSLRKFEVLEHYFINMKKESKSVNP